MEKIFLTEILLWSKIFKDVSEKKHAHPINYAPSSTVIFAVIRQAVEVREIWEQM